MGWDASGARQLRLRRGTISQVTSKPAAAQHLRDLARRLRRVRDRIDREYAQLPDAEALAHGAHMSAGHSGRRVPAAYGDIAGLVSDDPAHRARMALVRRGDLSVTDVCFAVGCLSLGTFSTGFTGAGGGAAQHLPAASGGCDGGDAVVRRETGDQTGQESRSAGPGATASLIAMDITIYSSFLPQDDPDAAIAFYRDILGFEVRNDVGYGGMRWVTVGPAGQPGTSIVLYPPAATPGLTDDERRTIAEMMAKGSYGVLLLATPDLDSTFDQVQAAGAEVVQEPTDQPYGVRDCAFRDIPRAT